jgi:hypothetical protein
MIVEPLLRLVMRGPIPMLPHMPSPKGRLFFYRIKHVATSSAITHTMTATTAGEP